MFFLNFRFLFCAFCVFVLFLYCFVYGFFFFVVSFLYLYKSTGHCQRVETQLQKKNRIISYHMSVRNKKDTSALSVLKSTNVKKNISYVISEHDIGLVQH